MRGKNRGLLFYLLVGFIFILVVFYVFKLLHKPATAIIAKVGNEKIYQRDLNTELANYPPQKNIDRKRQLLQKIVKDSIILQAGEKDGLIKLDSSVFDSSTKDYLKRVKLVAEVQELVEHRKDHITGAVLSIWFYNIIPA